MPTRNKRAPKAARKDKAPKRPPLELPEELNPPRVTVAIEPWMTGGDDSEPIQSDGGWFADAARSLSRRPQSKATDTLGRLSFLKAIEYLKPEVFENLERTAWNHYRKLWVKRGPLFIPNPVTGEPCSWTHLLSQNWPITSELISALQIWVEQVLNVSKTNTWIFDAALETMLDWLRSGRTDRAWHGYSESIPRPELQLDPWLGPFMKSIENQLFRYSAVHPVRGFVSPDRDRQGSEVQNPRSGNRGSRTQAPHRRSDRVRNLRGSRRRTRSAIG